MAKRKTAKKKQTSQMNRLNRFIEGLSNSPRRGGGHYYENMMELCRTRLFLVWIIMGLLFLGISVRIVVLPFLPYIELSRGTQFFTATQLRSDIIDRNGRLLASSAIIKSLNADVSLMRRTNVDFDDAAEKLATLFPKLDKAKLRERFDRLNHFPIRGRLTPEQVWQVRQLGIPGIYTLRQEGRIYPYGNMFSHLLGFVDNDNIGQGGVELRFNSFLKKGEEPLRLSVDVRFQHVLYRAVKDLFETKEAKAACGVIMEIASSEILALTSFPSFNPHDVGSITPQRYFNCVTQASYELGSTFKLVTAAMGLDYGSATLDTIYDTTRPIRFDGRVISDLSLSKFPYNLRQVVVNSSNVGAALIARDLGKEAQFDYLKRFGLLDILPVEFEGKSKPIIAPEETELRTMTIGFGHGIAVSPLHLASVVSAIIGGGVYRSPTILHIPELRASLARGQRIVSPEVSRAIRQIMYSVVKDGSGRNARLRGYRVGGKTGTAEKLVETSIGLQYSVDKVVSSFIAAFPIDEPKYLIYVVVDEPTSASGITGGRLVAPVVKNIISRMIPMTNIALRFENAPEILNKLGLESSP